MNITDEQINLARKGEVVRVAGDGGEFVILNAETYDRVAALLTDDPREAYRCVLSVWDEAGSPDDATTYQDLL